MYSMTIPLRYIEPIQIVVFKYERELSLSHNDKIEPIQIVVFKFAKLERHLLLMHH